MYLAYYGRPGDPEGVSFWTARVAEVGGNWAADLVNAFGTSAEYKDRFAALSPEALISNLYQQLFNRFPDPGGLAFYLDLLNGSNLTGANPDGRQSSLAVIALDIANGARGIDLDVAANEHVDRVRAQVFRYGWANPRWLEESTPYPSQVGRRGLTLTRDEDGRFSGTFSITDPAEVDDTIRLTALNAEGNRIGFIDAPLDASIVGSLFTVGDP